MDQLELRRQRRMAMRGVTERLGLSFAGGQIEMRSKPNGTAAGVNFEWNGYAAVYDYDFPMWDPLGEQYTEYVAPGAFRRSLNNPALDVPFLIGHNDAGIPLARTKSGTMQLAEDSRGLHVHVPSMDGRREEVRALASAVERGDMDEMSLAFICNQQQWNDSFERRGIVEADVHRGDVCAVVHGANDGTAGSWMGPVEQLAFRRPAAIGAPHLFGRESRMPTAPYERGADEHVTCPQCQSGNDADANACDQCGYGLQALMPYEPDPDDNHQCPWCERWNAPDAKVCDQCGKGLTFDRDADDPGYGLSLDYWGAPRPLERRAAMSTADINDLPDSAFAYIEPGGSKDAGGKTTPRSKRHFPVHDAAHVRNALARAPQSPFGDQAMPKIKEAAAKLGVGVSDEHSASRRPVELRASAAEDMNLASASDYGAAAAAHPFDGAHTHEHTDQAGGTHTHMHTHAGDGNHGHDHDSAGSSASVTVDASTGIPGDEMQMTAARKLELMARELELEELAAAR